MERRLAAILAADVVGYSRLIREDEAGTLVALKAHREADRAAGTTAFDRCCHDYSFPTQLVSRIYQPGEMQSNGT